MASIVSWFLNLTSREYRQAKAAQEIAARQAQAAAQRHLEAVRRVAQVPA